MKVASFDVFDTCLVRRVAAPTGVFRRVGLRLAEAVDADDSLADRFVAWRCEAEVRARRQSSREDVTLETIWSCLRSLAGLELAGAGPDWELEAESSLIGPIEPMQKRVRDLRARGRRILFLSDTSLPSNFLASCLSRSGILAEGEKVYTSGEVGLSKRSGGLFRHVAEAEGIATGDWTHTGDDPIADGSAPRGLGIEAVVHPLPVRSTAEKLLIEGRPPSGERWLDIAGALRFARLSRDAYRPHPDPGVRALVEGHLGPILCLFGHWVLERGAADGIEQIFFASRDARLTWAVCRRLAAEAGRGVTCRYLHVSRQALYLASSGGIGPAEMPWLGHPHGARTLTEIAARLELDPGRLRAAWLKRRPGWGPDRPLASGEEWRALFALISAPPFASELAERISARRACARAYLRRAGLLGASRAGLVDLGSLLYCQEALGRICGEEAPSSGLRGYYLYLKNGGRGPAEAGPAEAFFHEGPCDLPQPGERSWLDRTAALEHVLGLSDEPSVKGYDADGTVQFVEAPPAVPGSLFQELEGALIDYATHFGPCWGELSGTDQARDILSCLLQDLVKRPSAEAAGALRATTYAPDASHQRQHPLVEPVGWAEIARLLLPRRGAVRGLGPIWPEAGWALTPRHRRLAFKAAFAAGARWQGRISGGVP